MNIQKRETEISKPYRDLLDRISKKYLAGQAQAVRSVNEIIVETNWQIGKYIVEYEQEGNPKAKYGAKLLINLAQDLTLMHGRGFSRPNLNNMRQFYLAFPICQTLSNKLSWSHYCEIIRISDDLERSFYYQQNLLENWSVRELKRQKDTGLFLRLAMSKDKDEIIKLSRQGQQIETPEDIVKDVYVFEFLKIPEPHSFSETDLETRLIDKLRVIMNMYMGYFANEENSEGDNPPIGIILTRDKDELLVKYATYGMSSQLFIAKYQLYLPDKDELRRVITAQLETFDEDNKLSP